MKRLIVGLVVISFSLLLKSCNTTEPPPPPPDGEKPTLELKLEDVSCTEAWIELTTTNLQLPATITLKKDNVGQTISLSTADTVLYVDSLLPNKSYSFIASHSGLPGISSNELSITTMDTTSHNFTFEIFTFGTIGSSTLYDVAIISPENIWCVGEIMIADTSINGYTTYNAVHWDGTNWNLHQIMFYTICGQQNRTPYPASSIIAFSEDDIWIAMDGDQVARHNGITQGITYCMPVSFSIKKLWGQSPNSMYAVGDGGKIVFYNGTLWSRIESGTDLDFLDIYGANNSKTSKQEILAVCTRNYPLGKAIYRIEENTAIQISTDPIKWELWSVWFIPNRHYYVVGSGIYEKKILSDSLWKNGPLDITHYATTCIRGNGLNDVFVPGAFGEFLHFNGMSWHSYYEITNIEGSYGRVAVNGNLICSTGGLNNGQAIVLIGIR